MTTKQKKVLDYMIRWAEKEIESNIYDSTKQLQVEALASDGVYGMSNPGDAMFYALQEAGYGYVYVNDAAYGGERGGYMYKVIDAINPAFKEYFMKQI